MKTNATSKFKISWSLPLLLAALFAILVMVVPAQAATVSKPVVLTSTINDYTTKVQVYSAADTTVYVYNGSTKIASKKYSSAGVKTITIAKQASGSKLKFKAKNSSGTTSSTVSKTVKKLTSVKSSSSLTKPTVSTTIKSTTTSLKIKGYKGTKVVILNDAGEKIKTVSFTSTTTKTVKISKQTDTSCLYFYTYKNSKRSAIVKKTVTDATKPSTPTVTVKSATSILVKGEIGTAVYVKYGSNSGYKKKGYITSSSGLTVKSVSPTSAGKYSVKLKDAAGNVSKVKTVTSSYASSSSDSSSSDSLVSGDFSQKVGTGSATATVATSYTMSEGDTAYVGLASVAHDGRTVSTIADIASATTFNWTSSNTSVATVSSSSGKGLRSVTVTAKKAGSATITCTAGSLSYAWKITVKALESEYDYEIEILNPSNYTLYAGSSSGTRTVVIYYIKTDNPDKSTLSLNLTSDAANNGSSYDDITYTTSYGSSISQVSGGYVSCVVYKTAGTKTFSITEQIDSKHSLVVASAPTVKMYDGDAAEEAWYEDVLDDIIDSSMSSKEKINALVEYVEDNFKYILTTTDGTLVHLTTHEGVYWQTKEVDCQGLTGLVENFAELLGLKHTSGSSGTHAWPIIYDEDGNTYNPFPYWSSNNYITSWPMVIE